MRSLSTFNRLSIGTSALLRGFGTVVESYSDDRLYKRLSALGSSKGLVSKTINGYIREGRVPRKIDLDNCIKELRKFKRYHQALEVRGFPCSISVSQFLHRFYSAQFFSHPRI